jgi:hypothetical protein
MGFPLLANFQSGAFYPPHLVYGVLPFFTAARGIFLFHYFVAASGCYLLCRNWQYPPYLALIGGILFALGGTIVSLSSLLDHFQSAVWLPWVLLAWERLLGMPSWRRFLAFVSLLVLQFLAGSPELYIMSAAFLFLDGLRRKAASAKISYRRMVFFLFAANALVAAVTMIQLLPTMELLQQSRRQDVISSGEATLHSLHPAGLLNLFFLEKEAAQGISHGVQLFLVQEIPFFVNHYMGAICLIGISLWACYASRREKLILLGLVSMTLLMAMGRYTPVYPWLLENVSLLGRLRFPEKFFFLSYGLLLFVSLRGLFSFLKPASSTKGPLVVLSCLSGLSVLTYLALKSDPASLSRLISHISDSPISDSTLDRTSGILVNLERQVALLFGATLLLLLWKKQKIRDGLFQILITGFVFVDLSTAHQAYQYLLEPDFVYQSHKVIAAPDAASYRIFYYPRKGYLHPNYVRIPRKTSFPEFNALVSSNLLPNTGVLHGFEYMQELDTFGRKSYTRFLEFANKLPPENLSHLLAALNVKYVIAFRALSDPRITLNHHFPEYPSWVYRIDSAVPRAYVVPTFTIEKDPTRTLERLSSSTFDPLREVIVERSSSPPYVVGDVRSEVRIRAYANQRVTIRASLDKPGILVLADSFYPGWHAYVDGKEQEIVRANLFFRGVALPAGEHTIVFRYEPLSFKIGCVISLLSLTIIAVVTMWRCLRRRKRAVVIAPS